MTLATKERIVSRRQVTRDRYIRSTMPVFWVDLSKNDGSQFTSDDAYGHLATVTGALWTPQGRSFDRVDDFISVGNPVSLQLATTLTIGFWGKLNVLDASNQRGVSKEEAYALTIRNTNLPSVQLGAGDPVVVQSPEAISINTWYNFTFTYDGTTGIIYVNGINKNSAVVGYSPNQTNSVLLGKHSAGVELWGGLIGEVFIYNRALSAGEIQHNYLATKWRFR